MGIAPKRALALGLVIAAAAAGLGINTGSDSNRRASQPGTGNGEAPPAIVPAFGPVHPRLSDAGDQVVFSYQGAIWRMPATGNAPRTMTRLSEGEGFDIEPAWSPDGTRIACINSPAFLGGPLRVIRADDGTPLALPKPVVASDKLMFDPAGKRILGRFQMPGQGPGLPGPGGGGTLAWYDIETGALVPVRTGGLQPRRYALSQDGRWIALVTTLDVFGQEQTGNNGPDADLWKVPAEGGEPVKIVRFPARIHDLCWSRDDRVLDVATEVGGVHNDLWEIPLDDPERGARQLTFGQADEDRPSVTRDGRMLLYTDNRQGATALVLRDNQAGTEHVLEPEGFDYRRPVGRLELGVAEESGGPPQIARIAIRHAGGKFHAPAGALYRLLRGDLHFYADRATLDLPEGPYRVTVVRGPEYLVAHEEFTIRPGQTTRLTIALERWTDQRARGWYSGESHIHANYGYGSWYNSPRTMLMQCAGEDLSVANFMVANSDGNGVFDREYFRGRPDPLSDDRTLLYWNEEFRSTIWGHMTLLNLEHLVEPIYTGFLHTSQPWDAPSNADVADLTHDQEGLVNYTHPAQPVEDPYAGPYSAKALPMDVALGKIDSIDVMGSNHEANMPVWYRLLNCGFRLPASAGTDCFLNRIASRLPGSDRAYVRIEGEFSYRRWIENLKAGRTFVTNGPMLEFTVNGQPLGSTVRLEAGSNQPVPGSVQVRVKGRTTAPYPLDRIEVIQNGRIAATTKAPPGGDRDRRSIGLDVELPVERSGWVALRVYGPPSVPEQHGPAFAHSSAIALEVPGKPAEARADAEYFLAWIDRLAGDVHRRDRIPSRSREHIEGQLAEARKVYEKLARNGNP
jgi:hypothetical protein